MSNLTQTPGTTAAKLTLEEGVTRAIADASRLARQLGLETPDGMAATVLKVNFQRIEQGVPCDLAHWVSVFEAIKRAQGGSGPE